jgi:hypothetical protein
MDMRRLGISVFLICIPLAAGNNYGKLPLSFEPNRGQTDARVMFLARVSGYTLFVTSTEAVFAGRDGSVERMKLLGANRKMRIEPLDKQPGISNYFIGNDPSKWRTNVANYGRVALREVYPGIDLIFYGNERQLEYDWVVAPGADPKQIRVRCEGADPVRKNADGDLVLSASLRQKKPLIRQEGRRIEGGYVVHGREVAFQVARYDATRPLVIDPVLVYSTYLGGSGNDQGNGIAVDGAGNAYVTGTTASTNFPTTNPLQASNGGVGDAFVTKINAAGSALVYSTYLGGSGNDEGRGIAVDGAGNAYVTGTTTSTNFPTASPLQASYGGSYVEAFVTKINSLGNALLYSTYLGGSGGDEGRSIAVDGAGNAYVTGTTASTNFPTANPLQASNGGGADAFVTKINAAGSTLVYSTYLGGSGQDGGNGIAVDGSGNAYVTGTTSSTNFPTKNALQASYAGGNTDAFVTKINAAGSALVYSTYLGGSSPDEGKGIAVDGSGNAYVTGYTIDSSSPYFPTKNALQALNAGGQDAFVTKISAAGSLVYSTFLGGSDGSDLGSGIAVDTLGNAYVTGQTDSTNFPTNNPLQTNNDVGTYRYRAFVSKINAAGSSLAYSTYLGGSDGTELGNGIAVDGSGNAYVTGWTTSTNFPTANPLQASYGGGADAFVVSISSTSDLLNLAEGKTATQSSTLSGYPVAGASNAVDGNTDGDFYNGSVTHTNLDANAWWQVDLGTSAAVSSISIWNRTDCCPDRLSDYWVFVSDTPFGPSDTPATLQNRVGTWSSHQTIYPNPATRIPLNARGRYVRVQLSGTNYLNLAEVQVFGTFLLPLAQGKTATQSSTLSGYGSLTAASNAVDGNTDGSFWDGSVTHTNLDANAWWQVDLGMSAAVRSISIWNRTDCCPERLTDYWIFVSDTPFGPSDTPATLENRAGTWSSHQTSYPNPSTTITLDAQGRYVRVQLSGTNYLNLAEVQVLGAFPLPNLAQGKTAAQSSTLSGYGSLTAASNAVDGNTDGNFNDGSVTHTNLDANAWWQVDLGNSATISAISIWNRTDCCSDRLSDYWVFASNTPFSPSDTPATLQGRAGTWSSHQTSFPNPSTTISLSAPGRYVRVQLSGTNNLSLAEVQVFGQ